MSKPELYDNLPRIILNKLHDELGDMFKVYFDGDPLFMGQSWLPCIIVEWERGNTTTAPTGHDRWSQNIVIKLVANKMNDVGLNQTVGQGDKIIEVPTKKWLERAIFARDAETKQYIDRSVMGVLRRNFTMQGGEIDQDVTVDFKAAAMRPQFGDGNKDKSPLITPEAHVKISARELVPVPVRS